MEAQKNNSIIYLEKLLTREKSRPSLTDKEIYEYLKSHHVPMKGDTLFKKLVTKKSSSFFLSFKMKWLEKTRGWNKVRKLREVYASFVSFNESRRIR